MADHVPIATGTDQEIRFDVAALLALAAIQSDSYRSGDPFPHVVIDNFLPHEIAAGLLHEFPEAGSIEWKKHYHAHSRKLANNKLEQMGSRCRQILQQCNSSAMLQFLEALTGISGLIPDPYFVGGGMHQIERGGFLAVHADFNIHQQLNLHRRINLLLYLNQDWDDRFGGHLELWDRGMTSCRKKILPAFNRVVIFNTDDDSFHGHPDPLQCPEGRTRKSLALYYYTAGLRPESVVPHSTLYQPRPGSGDSRPDASNSVRGWRQLAGRFVPPIVADVTRELRRTIEK